MMTTLPSRLARPSAAVAAAAVLAFWFTFGGSQLVRAEDPETISPPGQDMILVPAKTVDALEKRVIYLEETVAALTESWQHIDSHRFCVSDDSGAETCISKAQLDAMLTAFGQAKASQASVSQEANASPAAEPVETAPTPPTPSEPITVVGEILPPVQDPEITGVVKSTTTDDATPEAAVPSYPKVESYEEPAARSDD
jgi:hypothetical protein